MSHRSWPVQPNQARHLKQRWLPFGLLFMALGLLISSCGGGDNTGDGSQPTDALADGAGSDAANADATSDADSGSGANGLWQGELQTISGDAIDMSAFADTDVVMWFWAPW